MEGEGEGGPCSKVLGGIDAPVRPTQSATHSLVSDETSRISAE